MTFASALAQGDFPVALEITPPKSHLPQVLLRRARLLGDGIHAVNVIQRPGRQSSLEASLFLGKQGVSPAWHLVTRGQTRTGLTRELAMAAAAGLQQVLCIRGDHEAAPVADELTIREAVAAVREALPSALVGATANQYAPDPAAFKNLLPKLAAGATYVQTQPVFDLAQLEPMAEAIKERAPETGIVAMVMPLLTLEAGEKIEARIGVRLPAALRSRLEGGGIEDAWTAFEDTLAGLVASPLVDGVAVMTFEMDAPEGMGGRIMQALRTCGIPVPPPRP